MRGALASLEKRQEWLLEMLELEANADEVWSSFVSLNGDYDIVSRHIREKKQRIFTEARDRGDLLTAMRICPIKSRVELNGAGWSSVQGTLSSLRNHHIQLVGLNGALAAVEDIATKVRAGVKISIFLDCFGGCEVDAVDACRWHPERCEPRGIEDPVRNWVHFNHGLFNRTVWELCSVFGFKRICRALKADIKRKDYKPELLGPGWGKYFKKESSEELLEHFFRSTPSETWVPTQGSSIKKK